MENVYSQLKVFHFRDKLDQIARGEVTPPLHVRLKPINACNHTCFFCCYRSEGLYLSERFKLKDMIPREKMREIVRDLGEAGVRAVTFTGGGEPLIYPFVAETIRGLLDRDVKVAVLTNGARLEGETAAALAEGASWVRVSLDAVDDRTMVESRGVKQGEFARIERNIREFARNRHADCELGINFIVTRMNAGRTYEFIRRMRDCGVGHVKVSECVVSTKGLENNLYHARHFESVKAQVERAKEDFDCEDFCVVDKFHDFDDKYEKSYRSCPFIQCINVIGADQVVYACQDKAYSSSGVLGSIEGRSLRELWRSDEYRRRVLALDPSRECDHHCVQHGKNVALLSYLSTDARHLEFV